MADQGENYTQISNEILEALTKAKLNGTQYAICLTVIRHTFGFHRCEAQMSAGFIAETTGTNPRQIKRELQGLIDRNIIHKKDPRERIISTIGINKDTSSWKLVSNPTPELVSKTTPDNLVSNPSLVSNPTPELVSISPPELVSNPSPKKERKKIKENSSTTIDHIPYQKIVDLYHELCPSFPKVMLISANRKTHIKARWEQHKHSIDIFADLFRKAETSAFLKGNNNRHWKADFDWLMNETNMAKVLEGKYDSRAGPGLQAHNHHQKGGANYHDSSKYNDLVIR